MGGEGEGGRERGIWVEEAGGGRAEFGSAAKRTSCAAEIALSLALSTVALMGACFASKIFGVVEPERCSSLGNEIVFALLDPDRRRMARCSTPCARGQTKPHLLSRLLTR